MWLLDANMDVHLVEVLRNFGVASDTAARRGWKALSNGELVSAAVQAGFDCLLTRDRLFEQFAAKGATPFPAFRHRAGWAPAAAVAGVSEDLHRDLGAAPGHAKSKAR